MKRHAEAAAEVAEVEAQAEQVEGPAHRLKVVEPDNLIVGQQYRIHVKGTSYERDRLGIYIHRDPANNNPVFTKINERSLDTDGQRFTHNTPIRFPPSHCIFFESGKTITAQKMLDPRGLPPELLNGFGGSRPIKRRTIRRRRIHRTVKRRNIAV